MPKRRCKKRKKDKVKDLLSIVIPSRDARYLQKTIDDILAKAKSNIEIVVVLDSYWPKEFNWTDPRLIVIHHGGPGDLRGMRAGINAGVRTSTGKYVMKTDEHCLFEEGFDLKLMANVRNNWVVVPRRYRLEADKWEIIQDGRPPVDYMRLQVDEGYLHGVEWKRDRDGPKFNIDNTPTFQGSCYFLARSYWDSTIGPLDEEHYGQFANEAQEVCLKAWLSGGRVVVNKNTLYAHWHKTSGGYNFSNAEQRQFNESVAKGRKWSYDYWTNHPGWSKFMKRFA